jgi:hypothetical protein
MPECVCTCILIPIHKLNHSSEMHHKVHKYAYLFTCINMHISIYAHVNIHAYLEIYIIICIYT